MTITVGELLLWKGNKWRVQAFSDEGGEIEITEGNGKKHFAEFKSATIVLECAGFTEGQLKKIRGYNKRVPKRKRIEVEPKQAEPSLIVKPTVEEINRVIT
jgi:hypothetical protein